ncbi:MAG TPA: hypothetical protein VGW57_06335 [Chthoniobacterales bacterium]|nr:hypothetical protein [Chthoniobacterales bacterium]
MNHRSSLLFAVTVGSLIVLFGGFTVVMWRLGFFSITGTDQGTKVIAAALAVVGAFVGAMVSIIGAVLKFSIDQQTDSRQATESARTAALQSDAEQRLKLEAAVQALQLFSTSSGSLSPAIQRDGALFMLMSFGQHDLTLKLVRELLSKEELGPGVAASVIDHAIRRGDEDAQHAAVIVFYDNAAQMVTPFGAEIPRSLANWITGLSDYVREWGVFALAKVMCARPLSEWTANFESEAGSVIAALSLAWTEEKNPRLKQNTGAILRQLLLGFPEFSKIFHPRMLIDAEVIRAAVAETDPYSATATDVVSQLKHWASPSMTAPNP